MNSFGVLTENVVVTNLSKNINQNFQNQRSALLGTIVKIESVLGNNNVGVRFLKNLETWESDSFSCPRESIVNVDEQIWSFLAAIVSPLERVKLAKNSKRCEKLMQIKKDMVVGFEDYKDVYLGTVKYIGLVKGIGKCFGLQLHQKRSKNKCDGSCAGIQYFSCLPGYGVFTTIEKIQLNYINCSYTTESIENPNCDFIINSDKNDTFDTTGKDCNLEDIHNKVDKVTTLNMYEDNSVNTNNDFDQNTVIQPEKNHLLNLKEKNLPISKNTSQFYCCSEIDLKDAIGSTRREVLNKATSEINGIDIKKINNAETSHNKQKYHKPDVNKTNDLTIGSLVEISNDVLEEPIYGVIRWMGQEINSNFILAGVELEDEYSNIPFNLTNGIYEGEKYFDCPNKKGLFVPLSQCQKDSRFQDGVHAQVQKLNENAFGKVDCPIVKGLIPPLSLPTEEDVEAVCGKFRGIQGHHNSCYLDATLFAMFTYTAVFDHLLYRPKGPQDIADYEQVQRVLREEIVNPLRTSLFVRADRVMNLRKLLDKLSSVSGLMNEEKDPEEFLNSLLAQIFKADPFLKLSSGQEAYYYQLFVEKDELLELPTVQQLFEQSFYTSDIKLKEVPSCLIIQMPRFGKTYKMYPRILPSQLLDVTDIIENSPRQCTVCGKLAKAECKQCFGECGVIGLESTAFCNKCLETVHSHTSRSKHKTRSLTVPYDFSIIADHCPPPRLFMELFAVVCIETSHYVAFVKCGTGHEAPWCFFDSMADRKGERNGYNIPEMVACPDVSKWLSDESICRTLHENAPVDRLLPEHARRLFCDAYICMYQSPDVMMYR